MDELMIRDNDDLPGWLRTELADLVRDFAHVSSDDPGGTILRNLSARGWAYLDSRIARRFAAGLGEGEREGAF